ncbi:Cell surface superoxide dismutase [Cu-Zn] 4 [Basidiobolus ranarum]|uniref:Cell surface superoxide dismutase [Cu-Zn] 4 n=1 Tax=Basidiobolus ranarum TaxID=34480 RepID=A0ABR2WGR7_9FUNG
MIATQFLLSAYVFLGTFTYVSAHDAEKAVATFSQEDFKGNFTFTSVTNGINIGVDVKSVIPTSDLYAWKVHESTLDASGSCTSAKSVLDPKKVGTSSQCTPTTPDTCQLGDLSGKSSKLNSTTPAFSVVVPGLSMDAHTSENSVVGRSLVIYRSDGTPLACANITEDHHDHEHDHDHGHNHGKSGASSIKVLGLATGVFLLTASMFL